MRGVKSGTSENFLTLPQIK